MKLKGIDLEMLAELNYFATQYAHMLGRDDERFERILSAVGWVEDIIENAERDPTLEDGR